MDEGWAGIKYPEGKHSIKNVFDWQYDSYLAHTQFDLCSLEWWGGL